jgi:predicted PurR-regulated permease PerM
VTAPSLPSGPSIPRPPSPEASRSANASESWWSRAVRRHVTGDGLETRRVEITPKSILFVALGVGACWVIIRLFPVLLVVVAALFLVGTLSPVVEALERRGLTRAWGLGVVFVSGLLLALGVCAITVPALADELRGAVEHEPQLRGAVADYLARARLTAPLAQALRELRYEAIAKQSAGTALAFSSRALEIAAYVASSTFLALYIMIDRDRLRGGLFALVPRAYHIRLSRVLLNLETIVGGYIRGQVLTSVLMTMFAFGLLSICRVPNALALSVFAGVADVLPYVGVLLSILPMALAAASNGLLVLGIVVGVMVAYEEIESRLLVPRIYGRALRLPSSIVLLSLLIGGTLLGIVGALLALPFAAGVRMLVEELRVALPGEDVDDTDLRARDERAEEEYAHRAEGVPAEQAAAIAVEISEQRQTQEESDPERAAELPITAGRDA